MPPESAAYLWDALDRARHVRAFVAGVTFAEYLDDEMRRAAVERQFEVIGEALNSVRRVDPKRASRIPRLREVVGMRNILIHGYADIDHRVVWNAATQDLAALITVLDTLLVEIGPPPGDQND
jgi:uncharacterized protein with HEPN domain